MRQALGLQGSPRFPASEPRSNQARPRRRFVQDGEVPAVILNSPKDSAGSATRASRVADLEAALTDEQAARASAERSLHEARSTILSLQTKLAHAELAHGEALAAERAGREQAENAEREAVAARGAALQQLAELVSARSAAKPAKTAIVGTVADDSAKRKTREPQPVKWWLSAHRAGASKR